MAGWALSTMCTLLSLRFLSIKILFASQPGEVHPIVCHLWQFHHLAYSVQERHVLAHHPAAAVDHHRPTAAILFWEILFIGRMWSLSLALIISTVALILNNSLNTNFLTVSEHLWFNNNLFIKLFVVNYTIFGLKYVIAGFWLKMGPVSWCFRNKYN